MQSSHKFLGCDFGSRMTIIRLASGNLLLHSPVQISDDIILDLEKLGPVKYLVAPNKYHHMYIGQYVSQYSEAEVWGAPGLSEKRKDLNFNGVLGSNNPSEWSSDIDCILFEGVPFLNEVVLFHISSKTAIFTDLIFNLSVSEPLGVRIFAWLDGVYGKPDASRLILWFMLKDRQKARESIKHILSWDFDRVSLTHKDIISSGGKDIIRKAFEAI